MTPIIQVHNLSKKYIIGQQARATADTLRELIVQAAFHPLQALRENRKACALVEPTDFWALKDVSFSVEEGEVLGVIGRNGAGKSTLLKVLSRITDPTCGSVHMRGRVASLLEVGTGFHPELTGRENIYLNGAVLGLRKREIDASFESIVAFAELRKFLDTPVKRYSSGMYVRLAFAVAAHLTPEILIIDEVLAVGDAAFQKKCLGKMSEVAISGRTVLFVSHNMAAVAQLCTKAIWLDNGQLQDVGTPDEVIRHYLESGTKHVCVRSWSEVSTAPGDERIRLLGVRLLQNDKSSPVVDINEEFRIEFRLQVLSTCRDVVCGIYIYDQNSICLFHSNDWRPNLLEPGRYLQSVDIPAQTLAEGPVSIAAQISFVEPPIRPVLVRDAITFDAVDSDHANSVRGRFKGTWPGVVRLALRWSNAVPMSEAELATTLSTDIRV